ncbi:MAG: acyl-CoA dehydrogenase family protein [Pirellulales bacterium]
MSTTDRQQQIDDAEGLLKDRPKLPSFAKELFFGRYAADVLPAYPNLASDAGTTSRVEALRNWVREAVDPVAIDRQAEIPQAVIDGLGRLGVLGACLPPSAGGSGLSQTAYCRLIEVLGGHCGSTALFVNAHHSIGPRALVLFGTPAQQQRWLPKLATGEWLSAFALTEPEAGSDAANVQTTATPAPERGGYLLNGQKRWITNGGIASVLTVMARTPTPDGRGAITAFLVTPDMPGFEVVEQRMEKCGVRGTATSRLAFHDMFVPSENILGTIGKGLKVALTVLDFGRTTFGASCTGAAKACLERAVKHANTRVQFGQTLGSFELVQQKLANMAAGIFAMEAVTYLTASLIDADTTDYMVETAMLKVFTTDTLWKIIDDTFQLHGGKAYFTDEPFERWMRDARINTIGEGANDVLRAFSALVGMRDVGMELQAILHAIQHPLGNMGRLRSFAGRRLGALLASPTVPVRSDALEDDAAQLGRLIGQLGSEVEKLLRTYRESVMDRQLELARISDAATELFVGAAVLARLDHLLRQQNGKPELQRSIQAGRHYLRMSARRIRANFAALWDNDDEATLGLARGLLG